MKQGKTFSLTEIFLPIMRHVFGYLSCCTSCNKMKYRVAPKFYIGLSFMVPGRAESINFYYYGAKILSCFDYRGIPYNLKSVNNSL